MEPDATSREPTEPSVSEDLVVLLRAIEDWADAAQGRVAAVARLVAAEVKLALSSVLAMTVFMMVIALFSLAAWVFLVMGLYFTFTTQLSMTAYQALFLLSMLHMASAYGLWRAVKRLTQNLRFTATRAALGGNSDHGASKNV